MSLLEIMDRESDCIEAIFQSFITLRNKTEIFLFFEGKDDFKYYISRLSPYTNNKDIKVFICKCKHNVIIMNEMINEQTINKPQNKLLFFVDSDYDENANVPDDIYVTSSYSIENYYFTDSAINRMLIGIIGYSSENSDDNRDFDKVFNLLKTKRREVIEEVIYSNAWYLLQIKKSNKGLGTPNLTPLNDYHVIKNISKIEELKILVDSSISIKDCEIEEAIIGLREKPLDRIRGKYFVQALKPFYKTVFQDAGKRQGRMYFSKKRKIHLNLSDLICELSGYADTPEDLIEYIKKKLSA
ncbi:MAG: DUF4435 domain-containing protein [Tissierellia bacterium]|nr:DUF4435 domain-containing protein [Tissierellia bacterium]